MVNISRYMVLHSDCFFHVTVPRPTHSLPLTCSVSQHSPQSIPLSKHLQHHRHHHHRPKQSHLHPRPSLPNLYLRHHHRHSLIQPKSLSPGLTATAQHLSRICLRSATPTTRLRRKAGVQASRSRAEAAAACIAAASRSCIESSARAWCRCNSHGFRVGAVICASECRASDKTARCGRSWM